MTNNVQDQVASIRVQWSAAEIEIFWRVCYSLGLEAACWPRRVAPMIAKLLARRFVPPVRILLVGDRDPGLAEALLTAGFCVTRLDAGPWLTSVSSDIEGHSRWLGTYPTVGSELFDLVLAVNVLECLTDDDVEPFLDVLRTSVRDGGHVIIVVPNGERLEYSETICPKTGIRFHAAQRLRAFDRASLRALFDPDRFVTVSELEVELDEHVLSDLANVAPDSTMAFFAHIGAGTTLIAIFQAAVTENQPENKAVCDRANRWLAARRDIAATVVSPVPERWTWTTPSVDLFWSRITGTPLDDLSFGKTLGRILLRGIEPWLVPGGCHLDVGAGEGHMVEIMASAGYPAAAFEPADGRARVIEAKLGGTSGFLGRLKQLEEVHNGTFDIVLACEVVEHVLDVDLEMFFHQLKTVLKPGGRLILSTPNAEELSRAEVYSPFGNVVFHRWQHVRRLTKESLAALLVQHGWAVDVIHTVDLAFAEQESAPWLEKILDTTNPQCHGRAVNLVAIAHRIDDRVQPPRQLAPFERRIARRTVPPSERRLHAPSGSLAPARLLPGRVTYETVTLSTFNAIHDGGFAVNLRLPVQFAPGDTVEDSARSSLRLFEDGFELGPAHALHSDITEFGHGRFSHWESDIHFSSSDATDPAVNGRSYVVVGEVAATPSPVFYPPLEASDQPTLVWKPPTSTIQPGEGNLFSVMLPHIFSAGDDNAHPSSSALELWEEGVRLGPAHTCHSEIIQLGGGRFSHWQRSLLFSSSDGTDPAVNGRSYVVVGEVTATPSPVLYQPLEASDQSTLVWQLPTSAIQPGEGNLFSVKLPHIFSAGDDSAHPSRSALELWKEGVRLGPAHTCHSEIIQLGGGRFSHWQRSLLFSTPDGTDPRHNGLYVALTRLPDGPHHGTLRALVSRAARSALKFALPVARTLLPASVKARLSKSVDAIERGLAHRAGEDFAARPIPLAAFKPALDAPAFADGPVILCNNALAWGGVERQVINTLRGLTGKLRRPPLLLCVRLGFGPDYDFYKGALADFPGEVRNVIDLAEAHRNLAAVDPALEQRLARASAWLPADVQEDILRFAGDFSRLRPSVVHVWQDALSISAGFAARMIGVPRVIVSSRNMAAKNFAYHRPYMADGYRELASCTDVVMLNNSEAGARDYADWLGLPVERYQILRNGIDTASISAPAVEKAKNLRGELAIPAGAPVVGSIFRFYPEKRPQLWIETAARISSARPDCHFVVFGTGPMKDDMLEVARAHGFAERLHLPGTIADAALGLSIMDIFLLTSEFEGTPNVVLEASLMGIPVVAVSAGGTAETIEDGVTGFVAASADPVVIAEQTLAALADDAWRHQVRATGPKFVLSRFGLDRMLAETLNLYGTCIAEP